MGIGRGMHAETDVLIVGGGVMGLAIALELRLRGLSVVVLSRDIQQAASQAAAGMLAPMAEGLPPGAMLDLSLQSRHLYPDWVRKLEDLSGLDTGYQACGVLMPLYDAADPHGTMFATSATPPQWLDRPAMHLAQPGLGADVIGGWWLPEEGQVDNRALHRALLVAAEAAGVTVREGVTVTDLEQRQGRVVSVRTPTETLQAGHYVLATGAWSASLLPLPVQPCKGQMFSVTVPPGTAELPLQRVIYGDRTYLVPRRDGRIVVGATVEETGFTPHNTAAGLQTLMAGATRLFPAIAHFPIQECWWGFRPATPDEQPILGASPCANLSFATGHHRNGILLTPITAQLLANWIVDHVADPLLTAFSWERFWGASPPTLAGALSLSPPTSPMSNSVEYAVPHSEDAIAPTPEAMLDPALSAGAIAPDSPLIIAGHTFRSRLMTGTGKYVNFALMQQSVAASGCEIVTVAVRRVQTKAPGHEGLAEALDWSKIWMLPNTAGCQTAEEAIRVARLGREMAKLLGQEDNNFVKLEVIPDSQYLLPDPIGTLQAAEQLVKEGFAVLPYINADPMLAKRLQEAGCATVMPLGSPIGSGQGIRNAANIQIIIENATVPVVVDAGIGAPSEAAQAMEMGADALLINTAIAQAQNPVAMGRAMGLATTAGRLAYLAGRIPIQGTASASSPLSGLVGR